MDRAMPLRIYVDTSVLGGCFDVEFARPSNGLIRDFRAGRFIPVLSDVTAAEVAGAPESVREVHQELLTIALEQLAITPDVLALVRRYESRSILSPRYTADMSHIALATIAAVDALVSWNFKHMVRLDRIRLFNEVNVQSGYPRLTILSPLEVTTYEGTKDSRRRDGPKDP